MPRNTTILVIEDHPSVLEAIAEVLREEYTIIKTKSADDGIQIIKKVRLDLIITDNNLPGQLSGLMLAEKLSFENNQIPIIMISGADVRESALRLGVKDFIAKPFDISQLRKTVRECLKPKLRLVA